MRLIFAPAAAKALASLPRADGMKLLARLGAAAQNPAGKHSWWERLSTVEGGFRIRQGQWHVIFRLDYAAVEAVVDAVLLDGDGPADIAPLGAAEAHERAIGKARARANHLSIERVQRMLPRL